MSTPRIGDDRHPHRITDIAAIKRFVLGGNARFTLVSGKTGTRFTYRVRASECGRFRFVSLLTGPDNDSSYEFVGTIFEDGSYRHGKRSRVAAEAPSAVAFRWFFDVVASGVVPATLEFWHEGRCGRCGRVLTVPESIATGFGPECAGVLGIEMQVVTPEQRTFDEDHGHEGIMRNPGYYEWKDTLGKANADDAVRDPMDRFTAEIQRRDEDEERRRMNRKFGLPLDYGFSS